MDYNLSLIYFTKITPCVPDPYRYIIKKILMLRHELTLDSQEFSDRHYFDRISKIRAQRFISYFHKASLLTIKISLQTRVLSGLTIYVDYEFVHLVLCRSFI